MQEGQKHWVLKQVGQIAQFRLLMLLTTLTFLFIANFHAETARHMVLVQALVITAYLCLAGGILYVILMQKNRVSTVRIDSIQKVVFISRTVLADKVIRFEEIKSLELYRYKKGLAHALIIGIRHRASAVLEGAKFQREADFLSFIDCLSEAIRSNEFAAAIAGPSEIKIKKPRIDTLIASVAIFLIAVYALLSVDGGQNISDSVWMPGALDKKLPFLEMYRIASSFVLHLNPIHLGANILCLVTVGGFIVQVCGRVRFINIFLCSAVMGAILSIIFLPHSAVIGASGGMMGLVGAYFVISLNMPNLLPGSASTSRLTLVAMLILQFGSDLFLPMVDMYSHLGGFLFGMFYVVVRSCISQNNVSQPLLGERYLCGIIGCFFVAGLFIFVTRL